MGDVTVSVIIDAAPDDIWEYLEQVERHVEWMADAESIRFQSEQHRGVGTQFACDTKIGPVRLTDRMEITEWEPSRAMSVEHAGLVTGTGTFRIEPVNAVSSKVTWTEWLTFPWFFGGRLGEKVGGATVLSAVWRRNLRRLKMRVEAGA
jgi:hypothetical protein